MKTKLIFLIVLFFGLSVFSQNDRFQKKGLVYYRIKVQKPGNSFHWVNAELRFNKTESLFIYNKIGMDSLQQLESLNIDTKKGKVTGVSVTVPSIDKKGNLTYRNFKTQKIILRFPKVFPIESYVVEDRWISQKWTIKDEHREIRGYNAQKAIAQFRGRIYIVWFTREIPVPYGPWKLFGLPGLILEVRDTANIAVFKVEKICYPCNDVKRIIRKPQEKEHKTLKEHVYLRDYYMKMVKIKLNEITKEMNSDTYVKLREEITPEKIRAKRSLEYEMTYEWEDYPGDTENPFNIPPQTGNRLETLPRSIPVESREK